ncbi:MAG: acyl carrier protein [Polyangiaceae bacterium]|jgi:acyl carrier protein
MTIKMPPTEEALREWMIAAVARLARVDVATVGPATAFEDLGLSSLVAVTLASELSDAFGIEVDALITWDYPTIGAVAQALSKGHVAGSLAE